MIALHDVLTRLKGVKPDGKGGYWAFCPCHDDGRKRGRQSLHINERDGKVLLHCFAGCPGKAIWQTLGLNGTGTKNNNIAATYDYTDEHGNLLFQVCRMVPKDFRQRRPDGNGGWIWNLKGVRRVLYRLPRLLEALDRGEMVFICEGEKDVHSLEKIGLTATTNPGGAGKWLKEYSMFFSAGSQVVILPDNDPPGRDHANKVAGQLFKRGVKVKIVELPGLPEKGDVSDWLSGGGTKEELLRQAAETPEWEPADEKDNEPQADGRPAINAGIQDLEFVSRLAIEALNLANKDEPFLFLRGGPVRIEPDEAGNLITRELTPDRLRYELARAARWYRIEDKDKEKPAKPPMDVVRDVLATPRLPFPVLAAITRAPTFAPDGTLKTNKGYHPESQTYYSPANGLIIPDVPEKPTADDVNRAKELIFTELLGDFPFTDQADRAHAAALLLLPFVRAMIAGPTPLHLVEASTQGSGKGLLAEVLLYPAIGRSVGVIPPPRDDEELRKSITARLREGRPAILFDNVYSLTSAVLAAALTAEVWDDRLLGRSETVYIPVRCAWVATANNATVSTDIARRSIRIRLTPQVDRPWLREDFRHPNLKLWIAEHRGELIWATLTLVRAWLAAGRPRPAVKLLGSYESWTEVIGGILECVGIDGFLANVLEFYEAADTEGAVWRQFVAAWWEKFGPQPVKASDLFPLAVEIDGFDLGKGSTERAQKTAFGMKLARQKDRIFDVYRIEQAGTIDNVRAWRLNSQEKDQEDDMPF